MLRWPARAKVAIRTLFQPLQDIDVYVEDEDDEVFYRTLLQRLVSSRIRIARVFCLGGRPAVVAAATAPPSSVRPALYIIDGDLDWVRGDPPPVAPTLFRHDAYCIENYLVCEQAVAMVVSQDAVIAEDDAKRSVALDDWRKDLEGPLVELFSAFATSNRLNPTVATVSTGVGVFCTSSSKGTPQALARGKVERATQMLLKETIRVAGEAATQTLYQATLARARALPRPIDVVSGKDFLLPLLNAHIQRSGCRVSRRALRMRLASACRTEPLSALQAAMFRVAAGQML